MSVCNVLRVNGSEERESYRAAVSEIIGRLIAEVKVGKPPRPITLVEIAEAIDVSLGTISNAFNRRTDLSPTYLSRLGKVFGPHAVDPYLKTFGCRAEPIDPEPVCDILPTLSRVTLLIAEARHPSSPGGAREIHTERLGYLPRLHEAQRDIKALICEIEGERDRMTGVAA